MGPSSQIRMGHMTRSGKADLRRMLILKRGVSRDFRKDFLFCWQISRGDGRPSPLFFRACLKKPDLRYRSPSWPGPKPVIGENEPIPNRRIGISWRPIPMQIISNCPRISIGNKGCLTISSVVATFKKNLRNNKIFKEKNLESKCCGGGQLKRFVMRALILLRCNGSSGCTPKCQLDRREKSSRFLTFVRNDTFMNGIQAIEPLHFIPFAPMTIHTAPSGPDRDKSGR